MKKGRFQERDRMFFEKNTKVSISHKLVGMPGE